MRSMFVRVLAWATTSTGCAKSMLLPTWSPWVWVLMIIVTGSSVTVRTWSRMASPQPGFLVSTSTTPSPVTSAAVFPPPPVIMYRLSLTCSIPATFPCATGRLTAAARPIAITAARTVIRLMSCLRSIPNGTSLFAACSRQKVPPHSTGVHPA